MSTENQSTPPGNPKSLSSEASDVLYRVQNRLSFVKAYAPKEFKNKFDDWDELLESLNTVRLSLNSAEARWTEETVQEILHLQWWVLTKDERQLIADAHNASVLAQEAGETKSLVRKEA